MSEDGEAVEGADAAGQTRLRRDLTGSGVDVEQSVVRRRQAVVDVAVRTRVFVFSDHLKIGGGGV